MTKILSAEEMMELQVPYETVQDLFFHVETVGDGIKYEAVDDEYLKEDIKAVEVYIIKYIPSGKEIKSDSPQELKIDESGGN